MPGHEEEVAVEPGMVLSLHAKELGESFGTRDRARCSIQPVPGDAGLQETT